jgi:hypothetical protein
MTADYHAGDKSSSLNREVGIRTVLINKCLQKGSLGIESITPLTRRATLRNHVPNQEASSTHSRLEVNLPALLCPVAE